MEATSLASAQRSPAKWRYSYATIWLLLNFMPRAKSCRQGQKIQRKLKAKKIWRPVHELINVTSQLMIASMWPQSAYMQTYRTPRCLIFSVFCCFCRPMCVFTLLAADTLVVTADDSSSISTVVRFIYRNILVIELLLSLRLLLQCSASCRS